MITGTECVLTKIHYVEILTLNVIELGGGDFGR